LSDPPSVPVAHSVELGAHTPVHAALGDDPVHAWAPQLVAAPQVPDAVQVWIEALPEHCVCPGAQLPEHAAVPLPATQVWFTQATGAPQVPDEVQVDRPLSEPPSVPVAHSVAPGEHTPLHEAPVDPITHAWLVQGVAPPQLPPVHVWIDELPAHWVAPFAHVPWHDAEPVPMTQVAEPQETAVPQAPVLSQVWTPLPEHCVAPGAHTPWQAPETQACAVHVAGAPQLPVASHDATPLLWHVVWPGAHTPWQVPEAETQVWLVHATAPCHWPSVPHTCEALPEQREAPGTQTPPQAALGAEPVHAYVQAVAAPQVPVDVHVCTAFERPASPVDVHCVWLGPHEPWHEAVVPFWTHVWLPQSCGVPSWPVDRQV
jgi:hypothetical protein